MLMVYRTAVHKSTHKLVAMLLTRRLILFLSPPLYAVLYDYTSGVFVPLLMVAPRTKLGTQCLALMALYRMGKNDESHASKNVFLDCVCVSYHTLSCVFFFSHINSMYSIVLYSTCTIQHTIKTFYEPHSRKDFESLPARPVVEGIFFLLSFFRVRKPSVIGVYSTVELY